MTRLSRRTESTATRPEAIPHTTHFTERPLSAPRKPAYSAYAQLHFNEGLVRDFIALVHEPAATSDRIEVVLMPRNYEWVKNPPEALDRQRTVVTRIERETGAAVRDYQHLPELDGRYFLDVSHLILHEGQDRFSSLLAEDWAGRF